MSEREITVNIEVSKLSFSPLKVRVEFYFLFCLCT